MNARDILNVAELEGRRLYEFLSPYRVRIKYGRSGPWRVAKMDVKFDLQYLRLWRDGRPPGLGMHTKLVHADRGVVMSDTAPEIDDVLKRADKLHGNLLVTGLGLGLIVRILFEQRVPTNVDKITVVEKDPHVIRLVSPAYAHLRKRLRIVQADAHEWVPDQKFDTAWHDIWDVGGDRDDAGVLRRHYRNHVAKGQQYAWGL